MPASGCPLVRAQKCWLKPMWKGAIETIRNTLLQRLVSALPGKCDIQVRINAGTIASVEW